MKWVPVKGYEDFYEVSDEGLVKSLSRTEVTKNRYGLFQRKRAEKILRFNTRPNGYRSVELYKNGFASRVSVHILVYESFIGERKPKACIHHIDGDKSNNRVSNLTELSYKDHNMNHSHEPWNKGLKIGPQFAQKAWETKRIKKCVK